MTSREFAAEEQRKATLSLDVIEAIAKYHGVGIDALGAEFTGLANAVAEVCGPRGHLTHALGMLVKAAVKLP